MPPLDLARRTIRTLDQAVIVEGYLDVIALHQAGFSNVVSPMGTALTVQQLYLLKRYSKRIVLALDSDAAGNQATLRGLQVARQAMDHEQDPIFDARGLLGYEARLNADIRVTTLPPGLDPDEVVSRDRKEWEHIVADARPAVMHVMEALAVDRNLDDPKVKNEIAAQVLPLIDDVPSAIERDTYRQRLARMLRVSEGALFEIAPTSPRSKRSASRSRGQVPAVGFVPDVVYTSGRKAIAGLVVVRHNDNAASSGVIKDSVHVRRQSGDVRGASCYMGKVNFRNASHSRRRNRRTKPLRHVRYAVLNAEPCGDEVHRLRVNSDTRHNHSAVIPRSVKSAVGVVVRVDGEAVDARHAVEVNAVSIDERVAGIRGALRHARAVVDLDVELSPDSADALALALCYANAIKFNNALKKSKE